MKSKWSLLRNFHRPSWWIESAIPSACKTLNRKYYNFTNGGGYHLMAEDWDNLVILDGCRYDLFKNVNTLDGELTTKTSPGSATPEFLAATFAETEYHDTVYVTANPMYKREGLEGTFHETIDVWEDHWDDELKTVHPDKVVSETQKAYDRYPNKRIISHFMQPHYPFIGETGRKLDDHAGFEWTYREVKSGNSSRDAPTVWELLEADTVSKQQVWDAYEENLALALSYVEELVTHFEEKTVVTSDHGNMLGEFATPVPTRVYGHPEGIHTDELVTVPWLCIDGTKRKKIQTESPEESTNAVRSEEVTDRLADLGYVEP